METMREDMRTTTTWSIVLGVLMIASGIAAIVLPAVAGLAVTVMLGWLLVFTGALHLGMAWRGHGAAAIVGEIVVSLLYAAVGIYLLARPAAGLASLTVALAVALAAKGVLEAVIAFSVRPLPGSGWLLLDGLVNVAIATLIAAAWPASTAWAVGILVGVSMVSSGFTRLMISSAVRGLVA
jgi:uncharacterized membrane protein HdeD (DUF308 family)